MAAAAYSLSSASSFFLLVLLGSALLLSNEAAAEPAVLPNLATLSFEEGYTQIFGDSNLMLPGDGRTVHLSLDQRTGDPPFVSLFLPPPYKVGMNICILFDLRLLLVPMLVSCCCRQIVWAVI